MVMVAVDLLCIMAGEIIIAKAICYFIYFFCIFKCTQFNYIFGRYLLKYASMYECDLNNFNTRQSVKGGCISHGCYV